MKQVKISDKIELITKMPTKLEQFVAGLTPIQNHIKK